MSPLARYAHLGREPDPARALTEAQRAYRETDGEVVLISKRWLQGWSDRELLDALAVKARVKVGKR
jgi:hypothetical protein